MSVDTRTGSSSNRGPSTALGRDPSTRPGNGASTGLGNDPSRGLQKGPSTGSGSGPATDIPRGGGMFTALANHNYRIYLSGSFVSNIGTWMQRVAQDWLVLELSG